MKARLLVKHIGFAAGLVLAPSLGFAEGRKPAGTSLQKKFGVAALLSESSQSFVDAVREGSESHLQDFPISSPKPLPAPVAKPASVVSVVVQSADAKARFLLEERKREIQMLEYKIAREKALTALRTEKVAPVVRKAPRTASDRLLASLQDKGRAVSFQAAAREDGSVESLKKKQQLAYLTNASGGRDLQAQLEYHNSPRGSMKGRLQRQPSGGANILFPQRPSPYLEGSYRHALKGDKGQAHVGTKSAADVSAAGLVAGSLPAPVLIEVPRAIRVITDSGASE